MHAHAPIPLDAIRAAQTRLAGTVLRTPLVRLAVDAAPAEIWLKLENLQPIGSFKLHGAGNALAQLDPAALAAGVWTASAGNMAQGVAWACRAPSSSPTAPPPRSWPRSSASATAS